MLNATFSPLILVRGPFTDGCATNSQSVDHIDQYLKLVITRNVVSKSFYEIMGNDLF